VAYDEDLADRIRERIASETAVTEMKMFGGLAFLVHGHMAVAASGQGGVLVRVDPARSDALVASTKATIMEMRGRPMAGWMLRPNASSTNGSSSPRPMHVRSRRSDGVGGRALLGGLDAP
jgi:hypothetical protein